MIIHAIQDEYPDDFAWCYGCGRLNKDGYHFRTGWQGNETLTIYEPPENQKQTGGVPGFLYGGFIASLIDCHGTGSASLAKHRENGFEPGSGEEPPRFVTGSLHVDYLKPTPRGVKLKAVGKIEIIHPKKLKVLVEVFADDMLCAKGEVIAVAMPKTFIPK